MKIVSKKELLKLPIGTVFVNANIESWNIEPELMVLTGVMNNDFSYQLLNQNIEASNFEEQVEIFENRLKDGADFDLDWECTMREGFFDDSMYYAVYSKEDVKSLIGELEKSLNMIKDDLVIEVKPIQVVHELAQDFKSIHEIIDLFRLRGADEYDFKISDDFLIEKAKIFNIEEWEVLKDLLSREFGFWTAEKVVLEPEKDFPKTLIQCRNMHYLFINVKSVVGTKIGVDKDNCDDVITYNHVADLLELYAKVFKDEVK